MASEVSLQTLKRLPEYICYLKRLVCSEGFPENISSKAIAEALNLGEIQVRKDLAAISTSGRPKTGFPIKELIKDLELYLGYNNVDDAVLVGAGRLGMALYSYSGFKDYGLNVVAAFDDNPSALLISDRNHPVYFTGKMKSFCSSMNIRIGIITVPADNAQSACDELVGCGIKAIWNFAPVHLKAPQGILIKNENLAASLAMLSKNLTTSLYESEPQNK